MARYIEDKEINQPLDVVSMVMEDYIYHNRFTRTDWQGEPVYRCTDAEGKERYLKWSYTNGIFHIEAWMKGPFGDEMDLSGIGGGKSRKEYRESIEKLIQDLRNHSGNTTAGGYVGDPLVHHEDAFSGHTQQPAYQQTVPQQPAYQQTAPGQASQSAPQQPVYQRPIFQNSTDIGRNSSALPGQGLVLGIIAIIFSFIFPIVGIFMAVIGLQKSRIVTTDAAMAGKAKAAKVCCIIAIVLSLCVFFLPFLLSFSAFFRLF